MLPWLFWTDLVCLELGAWYKYKYIRDIMVAENCRGNNAISIGEFGLGLAVTYL